MLKRKNIPFEDSLARACKDNGLIYKKGGGTKRQTITLIDDDGLETIIDRDLNIIKPERHPSVTVKKSASGSIIKASTSPEIKIPKGAGGKIKNTSSITVTKSKTKAVAHSKAGVRQKARRAKIAKCL